MDETSGADSITLATELTIAWLSNPNTRANAEEVPSFLEKMHRAVAGLSAAPVAEVEEAPAIEHTPAVSVRKSLASRDFILSMIDGKPYKTLRRHLATHGMTPEQYRERYNLKSDYPMVAETYSEHRRDMAKKIGLGRKPRAKVEAPAEQPAPKAPGRRRKATAEA